MAKNKLARPTGEIELRPAWRRDDRAIEGDAIAFWRRLAILPGKVSPEARARELVAAAYQDGRLVGVTTASLERLEFLRARLAMLRGAVDPEFRRGRAGTALAIYSRDLIERWSYDHPHERVAGLGAIVESPDLIARQREPIWPQTRFVLVGHTKDGRQIRVSWFEDFRLD